MKTIRPLKADEIEVRLSQGVKGNVVQEKGTFLLYKDARCDMRILDEVFTPFGWQREHKELNGTIYCGVSIKNPDNGEWITKWDCGSESDIEKQKGLSSDSFKRACFNWGIGVELYTAPRITIAFTEYEKTHGGRILGLSVSKIEYENGRISQLTIVDGFGNVRFTYDTNAKAHTRTAQAATTQTQASQQAATLQPQSSQPASEKKYDLTNSKIIRAVNDYVNGNKKAKDYFESQYGMIGGWSTELFKKVYNTLVLNNKIDEIQF